MISKKYKEVIKNLEDNIDSKRDLDYAKKQVSDLTALYIDELTNITTNIEKKLNKFEKKISNIESKIFEVEQKQNEELIDDNMLDLEPITCPYCNYKFLIEYDVNKTEIKCPECDNLIELSWEEYEEEDM